MRHRNSFIADQRGAVAFEMPFVWLFMMMCLLLPLADLAIAGFRFISAHQALRDMGQRTQYSTPDATDPNSITNWKSSLPTTVDGYPISAKVYCGDPGQRPPARAQPGRSTTSFQQALPCHQWCLDQCCAAPAR